MGVSDWGLAYGTDPLIILKIGDGEVPGYSLVNTNFWHFNFVTMVTRIFFFFYFVFLLF